MRSKRDRNELNQILWSCLSGVSDRGLSAVGMSDSRLKGRKKRASLTPLVRLDEWNLQKLKPAKCAVFTGLPIGFLRQLNYQRDVPKFWLSRGGEQIHGWTHVGNGAESIHCREPECNKQRNIFFVLKCTTFGTLPCLTFVRKQSLPVYFGVMKMWAIVSNHPHVMRRTAWYAVQAKDMVRASAI